MHKPSIACDDSHHEIYLLGAGVPWHQQRTGPGAHLRQPSLRHPPPRIRNLESQDQQRQHLSCRLDSSRGWIQTPGLRRHLRKREGCGSGHQGWTRGCRPQEGRCLDNVQTVERSVSQSSLQCFGNRKGKLTGHFIEAMPRILWKRDSIKR